MKGYLDRSDATEQSYVFTPVRDVSFGPHTRTRAPGQSPATGPAHPPTRAGEGAGLSGCPAAPPPPPDMPPMQTPVVQVLGMRRTRRPQTFGGGGGGGLHWNAQGGGGGRASFEQGGEGGRGFWTQNLVYQKWPDQIFPIVNFVFSHCGHFGLGRGGGGLGEGSPPLGF